MKRLTPFAALIAVVALAAAPASAVPVYVAAPQSLEDCEGDCDGEAFTLEEEGEDEESLRLEEDDSEEQLRFDEEEGDEGSLTFDDNDDEETRFAPKEEEGADE